MRSQTKIFAKLVKDFMLPPRVCVDKSTPCSDVIAQMVQASANCAVFTDSKGKLAGILRKNSILSDVVFKVSGDTRAEEVMDSKVPTLSADEYFYHAIGRMRRLTHSEIVVLDDAQRPVGLIRLQRAYELAAERTLQHIDRISSDGDVKNLKGIKEAQVALAHDLFEDNLPAPDIQQLLSHVNNDAYNRLIQTILNNMENEGWGTPPVDFCVIVMGSGGRGENYLYPDQDNGFILEDYPDEDHSRIDRFFVELAQRLTDDLNAVGFPYCTGNVMATNPLWRKTATQWREQIALWGRKRNDVALRLADIFFDFQCVWGKHSLAEELRQDVLALISKNHFFLQSMFQAQSHHDVALGMFNKLAVEDSSSSNPGEIDLKYRASLPLVESIRLLALQNGLGETSTLKRMEKLHKLGVLNDHEADYLASAFGFITHLLLSRQVKEFESNEAVTRFVDPKSLSKREKENLITALEQIDGLKKRLKGEMTGDLF